jgi:hypothetical protein
MVCEVCLALPGGFPKVGVVETPAVDVAVPAAPVWGRCIKVNGDEKTWRGSPRKGRSHGCCHGPESVTAVQLLRQRWTWHWHLVPGSARLHCTAACDQKGSPLDKPEPECIRAFSGKTVLG